MKATLYEALGIAPTASDEEVRAALRRLIRKYYAKTRDGQGNVEEALRFINHASRILSEPEHRQRYDQELLTTTETNTEERIAHFVTNVAIDANAVGTATQAGERSMPSTSSFSPRLKRRKNHCIIPGSPSASSLRSGARYPDASRSACSSVRS